MERPKIDDFKGVMPVVDYAVALDEYCDHLEKQNEWISVKDGLPEYGDYDIYNGISIHHARFTPTGFIYMFDNPVTHYKPPDPYPQSKTNP